MKATLLKTLSILYLVRLITPTVGQDLPKFIDLSDDNTEIITEGGDITGFYNEGKLRQIYLEFSDANYWTLLEEYYDTDNYVEATLIYKDDTLHQVGVQFKGNTSYTKLAEDDEKMSFSIKTDQFIEDQDIDGYSNLNLNNAYEDNSMMREIIYAHLCRQHIPAPQANFIELYINGEYWGPYANVQQVNKDMLKEWFMSNDGANFRAIGQTTTTGGGGGPGGGGPGGGGPGGSQWGDGTAALNYHDDDSTTYQEYYTLKSSDIDLPWEKLISVCDQLNNTTSAELENTIGDFMDVDRTLWFLAHEIIYSDDDSYIYKGEMDYYVYYEPETGRMVPLEFDGNSCMGTNNLTWDIFKSEENENFPLQNRLFAIPELRQRYLAHVRTILEEEMDITTIENLIDTYQALIDSSIQSDTKKLMTYSEFNTGVSDLKTAFSTRKSFIQTNSEVSTLPLEITDITFKAYDEDRTLPYSGDPMNIIATISTGSSGYGIDHVTLYYSSEFVGQFTETAMYDDGLHNDNEAHDGVYGGSIPGATAGTYVRYYIDAVANDANSTVVYSPAGAEHHSYIYKVRYDETSTSDLVINELMASNDVTHADNFDEFDDWIEIHNKSDLDLSLDGYYLTDNIANLNKFALPATTIEANGYSLIWADEDESQGDDHANFKLNADGEDLFLVNPSGEIVDQVSFFGLTTDVSYERSPNGTGDFSEGEPTVLANNDMLTALWGIDENTASSFTLYPNPTTGAFSIYKEAIGSQIIQIIDLAGVVIHEQVTHSDNTFVDATDWSCGMYFVRIGTDMSKIIIE